ncbi:hypothetical protein [Spirillospora sp. NPDC029432]|uniref:hypothetical protein n=1 Tax=Spirillospora sp. NPDC029432 TaxID=3154599 RepID=UPI003452021B
MNERRAGASDWTEQDLLTRELALERLAEAEAETVTALEELRASPAADPGAVELLERRLSALEASRARLAT